MNSEAILEKIFTYINMISGEKDFKSTISLLTDLGKALANSERASFWYRDMENNTYVTIVASDRDPIVVPKGSGIVGAAIENNETIIINEPYSDPRFNPMVDKSTGFVTHSILCIPVTNELGKVIGAYQAINKLGEDGYVPFDESDAKMINLASVFGGKILESHLLYKLSHVDQLTGLKNRRSIEDYYDVIAKKDGTSGIIMCDIDFFKKVNDIYGHNTGDAVLVNVSQILFNHISGMGEVFRWGGEEFIVILDDSSLIKTKEIAENLRRIVECSKCTYGGESISVTMSFGVWEIDKCMTLTDNVKNVDLRLYLAKKNGRNRVEG